MRFLFPAFAAALTLACQSAPAASPQQAGAPAAEVATGEVPAPAAATPAETAAIAAIAAQPRVKVALAAIEAGEAQDLKDLIELTQIPAPSFEEGPRGKRFAEMLKEAGLQDVSIDQAGNVIARRYGTGDGPILAFVAHLDTVFPQETDVTVKVEGDTYRAPGIGDNTRGLVYLLSLLRGMNEAGIRTKGDILFIGNVGEEGLGDLKGVKHLFRPGGPRIDTMIAIDGGKTERVVNEAVGSLRYKVTVKGPGGHSYGAFGQPSPHHALGRIIAAFDEIAAPITATGRKSTYSVGRIGGGTSVNSIPFESWMEVDMRSAATDRLALLNDAFKAAVQTGLDAENAGRTRGEPLTVEIEPVGDRPAGRLPNDAPLMRYTVAALAHMGMQPDFEASSTDSNTPLSLGVPALTLARGGESGNAHSPDEWWRNTNAYLAPQTGLLIALSIVGLAP
jgi:tripeptide aminopeptidase